MARHLCSQPVPSRPGPTRRRGTSAPGPALLLVLTVLVAGFVSVGPAAVAASPPGVLGMSPTAGPVAGGTQVVLHGSGFTGAKLVHFGGVTTTRFRVATNDEMRVFSPPHGAGTVYVTVTNRQGTSIFVRAGRFRYTANPAPLVRSGTARTAPPVASTGAGVDLSCVSAAFCAAGGSRGVAVYDGTRWGGSTPLADRRVTQVACGSPTLCLAATVAGTIWRYDGRTWAVSRDVGEVLAISCGLDRCAASTVTGTTSSLEGYDGTTWTQQPGDLSSVSCFRATECVGTGVGTYQNFSDDWGPTNDFYYSSSLNGYGGVGGGALSCLSYAFCVDGNGGYAGQYAVLTGSTWSYGLQLVPRAYGHVDEVDCASVSFCATRLSYHLSGTTPERTSWLVVDGHARTSFAAAPDAAVSCWAPYGCMLLSPRSYFLTRRG